VPGSHEAWFSITVFVCAMCSPCSYMLMLLVDGAHSRGSWVLVVVAQRSLYPDGFCDTQVSPRCQWWWRRQVRVLSSSCCIVPHDSKHCQSLLCGGYLSASGLLCPVHLPC
jgi:hypothetical protein